MATNVKNAIAKALINGVVTDLFLKTGVENVVITEKRKLANIADGAQVNKMESVKVNGAAQAIAADKSVNISVPVIYAQADQPAGLKAGEMWFQIIE